MSGGRILVVLAHPDDESFIIGGTLARYALQGAHITLVCATRGEMGRRLGTPPIATRETLPILREQELREACRALGIQELHFLGLRDKTVDYYDPRELAERIVPFITEAKPDVLITFHEKLGGHPDHCAIGRAATLAHRLAGGSSRLYFTLWSDYRDRLPEVRESTNRVTTIAINGDAARRKMLSFRAHRTQSELDGWLWKGKEADAVRRLTGQEYFLQGSGPARPGETDLLP